METIKRRIEREKAIMYNSLDSLVVGGVRWLLTRLLGALWSGRYTILTAIGVYGIVRKLRKFVCVPCIRRQLNGLDRCVNCQRLNRWKRPEVRPMVWRAEKLVSKLDVVLPTVLRPSVTDQLDDGWIPTQMEQRLELAQFDWVCARDVEEDLLAYMADEELSASRWPYVAAEKLRSWEAAATQNLKRYEEDQAERKLNDDAKQRRDLIAAAPGEGKDRKEEKKAGNPRSLVPVPEPKWTFPAQHPRFERWAFDLFTAVVKNGNPHSRDMEVRGRSTVAMVNSIGQREC